MYAIQRFSDNASLSDMTAYIRGYNDPARTEESLLKQLKGARKGRENN